MRRPVPAAEEAAQRLRQAETLSRLTPEQLRAALLPTMFTEGTAHDVRERFGSGMLTFHPAGFRAMARASAEDLRDALPHLTLPTLLIYGDQDVRAPLDVAQRLHSATPQSSLAVLPGVGRLCNVEAADDFNSAFRTFLREHRTDQGTSGVATRPLTSAERRFPEGGSG